MPTPPAEPQRPPLRVLVVGPRFSGPDSRGGMASVVTIMRERHDPRASVRTVSTYVDDTRRRRLVVGVRGVALASALLLGRRADVVHVHLAHGGSVVRKAVVLWTARIAGVPAVVHAHSYDFAGWFDRLGPRGQGVLRRAMPARRWLVLGDELALGYARRLRLPEDRVFVLRNPVLPLAPAERIGDDLVRGVFLGRHGTRKGSFDLVAAIGGLEPDVRARLRIVAAGDGDVEQVRAAAKSVADVLSVSAWVDPDERNTLLAGADIFVLPSYDEGLPMALLEAMGAGLTPVVTPVGAIDEVVTDGVDALLVSPGDVPALAAALTSLVRDRELRVRLSDAALRRAADLGVGPWFDSLVTHWREVTARADVGEHGLPARGADADCEGAFVVGTRRRPAGGGGDRVGEFVEAGRQPGDVVDTDSGLARGLAPRQPALGRDDRDDAELHRQDLHPALRRPAVVRQRPLCAVQQRQRRPVAERSVEVHGVRGQRRDVAGADKQQVVAPPAGPGDVPFPRGQHDRDVLVVVDPSGQHEIATGVGRRGDRHAGRIEVGGQRHEVRGADG